MKDPRILVLHALECVERVPSKRSDSRGRSPQPPNDGSVHHAIARRVQGDPGGGRLAGFGWFRNVLVHDYLGVSVPRVWEIVQRDLPAVKIALEVMRRDLEA